MADKTDRRGFLNKALLSAAGVGAACSLEEKILLAAVESGKSERKPAAPAAAGQEMPCGKIGKLSISRIVLGGNLIGGWSHSRDLLYVSSLFKAYNTDAKVFETLELAQRCGINTIQNDPAVRAIIAKYNKGRKEPIQTMVCFHPQPSKKNMRTEIHRLIDDGATLLYTHGMVADEQVRAGAIDVLGLAMDLVHEQGVPAGIGGHSLETPMACEKNKLNVDYYVKTFHPDNYWSATPKANRDEWCWYNGTSPDHDKYHDNIFCVDAEKTAAFMATVAKPWVAFKIMAAGAIPPRMAFPHAFRHGADFVPIVADS